MSNVLEIKDIKQAFRVGFWMKKAEILHGFSFDVKKGSIFGLLGANGAGKTTLIHLIAGFRRPVSGTVSVCGYEATSKEARSKIGYLPERPYFHDHLTGEKFLQFMGTLSGMNDSQIKKRIPEVLERVGLKHAQKTELKRYSKGMLQRVGIAQAILHDPELLILDEPSSGLDPVGRLEVRELILDLHRSGKTIFFSSHIIPDVESICEEVALIVRGSLSGCGKPLDFFKDQAMKFEIGVAKLSQDKIQTALRNKAQIETIPEGFKLTLDQEGHRQEAIESLVKAGGDILWASPIRPSLEEVFAVRSYGAGGRS